MPTALARFGTDQAAGLSCSYSRSWGMAPGIAQITTGPEFSADQRDGDLVFYFQGSVFLRLPGCRLVRPSLVGGPNNAPEQRFEVLDRSWKWQFGIRAYGDFNKVRPDGVVLRPASPRDLVFELWGLLGEVGVDCSALPTEPRPRVVWDAADPAIEIEKLCAAYGCVPFLDPFTNKATVAKIGEGEGPPNRRHVNRTDSRIVKPAPDVLRAVGGIALFQQPLQLGLALALEADGSYKILSLCSYMPKLPDFTQLGFQDPFKFTDVTTAFINPDTGEEQRHRELAQASVYRVYEIRMPVPQSRQFYQNENYPFPEDLRPLIEADIRAFGGVVFGISQNDKNFQVRTGGGYFQVDADAVPPEYPMYTLGPFTGSLLEKQTDGSRKAVYARGIFADERLGYQTTSKRGTRFPGDVTVDGDRGLFKFSQPLFAYEVAETVPGIQAGFFVIRSAISVEVVCAFAVSRNGVPIRFEEFTNIAAGTREHFTTDDNAVVEIIYPEADGNGSGTALANTTKNVARITEQLRYLIEGAKRQFEPADATQAQYGGLQPFSLTGRIRSVSWSCGTTSPPMTSVSWDCEKSSAVIPWEQRPIARQRAATEVADRQKRAAEIVGASSGKKFNVKD